MQQNNSPEGCSWDKTDKSTQNVRSTMLYSHKESTSPGGRFVGPEGSRMADAGKHAPGAVMAAGAVVTALFLAARFHALDADFPLEVTRSGVLFTDEGWYANAATRQMTLGHWHLVGDFNPAVNMPLGQVLLWLSFQVCGRSIVTARMLTAMAYAVFALFTMATVRLHAGTRAALVVGLLLATNYVGFAYSRLGIMEMVANGFVAASLYYGVRARISPRRQVYLHCAAALGAAACLTKGTMLFVFPVLSYVGLSSGRVLRQRVAYAAIPWMHAALIFGGVQFAASRIFHEDYAYFYEINVGARRVSGLGALAVNLVRHAHHAFALDPALVIATGTVCCLAFCASRAFRRDALVHLFLGEVICYLALLLNVEYGPPRYYLPLLGPLAGLLTLGAASLARQMRPATQPRAYVALAAVLLGTVTLGAVRIAKLLTSPRYSMVTMLRDARRVIDAYEDRPGSPLVLGNFADTLALETGVRSMNSELSTVPLPTRLGSMGEKPRYALLQADTGKMTAFLHAKGARLNLLGVWDVYDNYYGGGEPVSLFAVEWR